MKDYFNVEPDAFRLMNKHFNHGRAGHKIRYIVRHHFAGIGDANTVWGWWQTRQASAHYVVETSGRVVQMVYDRDTAWHAGNLTANRESIGIEHANSGGGPDWPIPDATVDAGAKLAAALCWFYKLGRPHYGTNIRDHRSFFATSCPHHLAAGGRYHDRWMRVAQEHYDWMVAGGKASESKPQEGITVSEADRIIKHLQDFITGFVGPVGSDVKDVREQMCGAGSRDAGSFSGWPQLGTTASGDYLTLVDAVAALRRDLDSLRKEIKR